MASRSSSVRAAISKGFDKIRILAVNTVQENPVTTPAEPLFDTLGSTSNRS